LKEAIGRGKSQARVQSFRKWQSIGTASNSAENDHKPSAESSKWPVQGKRKFFMKGQC